MNTIYKSVNPIGSFRHFLSLLPILLIFLFAFKNDAHEKLVTLDCPDKVTVNLDPCDDGFVMDYTIVNWTSTEPVFDTVYSPPEGTFLLPGIHPGSITAHNTDGSISTCSFLIDIDAPTHFAICEDIVEVSLEMNCHEEITFDEILDPISVFCEQDITINVIDQLGGIVATGSSVFANVTWIYQQYTISITEFHSGITCWAPLNVLPNTVFNMLCPGDITIACHEPVTPENVGAPGYQTCFLENEITLDNKDVYDFRNCPDSIDFILTRTWTAQNPLGETSQCIQTITGKRYDLSEVIFPPNFDGMEMPVFQCNDSLFYPELVDTSITGIPLVNGYFPDLASCDFTVTFSDVLTNICGESYEIDRKWKVIDWCSTDIREHIQKIVIEDNVAPVFETVDTIWASSTIDCLNETMIPPIQILSECSNYSVEIRLPDDTLYTDGGIAFVVLSNGAQKIEYFVTDDCGNMSTDSSIIFIEPASLLSCPTNMTVSCNDYFDILETPLLNGDMSILHDFGEAIFYANCSPELSDTAIVNVDPCGIGTIQRIIQTQNFQNQETCNQTIQVEHVSDLVVQFPADVTVLCTDELPDAGQPVIINADCESYSIEYSDEFFDVVPGVCFKIVRTWAVTNFCQYDSTDLQKIIESPEIVFGMLPECDLDGDGNCSDRTFQDGLSLDNFPNPEPDGYIEFQQVINVLDDSPPNIIDDIVLNPICIEDNSCGVTVTLPMPEVLECGNLTFTVTSGLGTGTGPFSNVEPGNYSIMYNAFDGCGNSSVLQKDLIVLDCKAPSALCKNGIIKELNQAPDCTVEIFAQEFDDGSFDNCSTDLTFTFSPNNNDNAIIFDADNLGQSNVELWVTDEYGNQNSCLSFVIIEDNSNSCDPGDLLYGFIQTQDNEPIKDVTVTLSNSGGFLEETLTDQNGFYELNNYYDDELITPEKDVNPLNGVTTFDLVLLQKHVLFIEQFDSPYKYIAADANNSGSVTIFDAVVIKKVILFIDPTFPNNKSWRFVDKSYNFPNPGNPWHEAFPESIEVDNYGDSQDFIGIKIGDLNQNANPQNFEDSIDRNFEGKCFFSVPEITFEKGATIEVPFKLNSLKLSGYQFTLEFDHKSLELVDIIPGFSIKEDFGFSFLKEGILLASWVSAVPTNETLAFQLIFKTKTLGNTVKSLKFNHSYIPSEAYSKDLKVFEIDLFFETPNHKPFNIFQNRPNPFEDGTNLPFYLPESAEVKIDIFSLNGIKLFSETQWHPAGFNEKKIDSGIFPQSGVFIYQVRYGEITETRRMVYIK